MTDFYVRSATGNDNNDALSWATARYTIVGALLLMAPGDTLYLAEDHTEGGSPNRSWVFPGTPDRPNRVICAVAGPTPPTVQAFTANMRITVGGSVSVQGSVVWYGVKINAGTGTSSPNMNLANSASVDSVQVYNDCELSIDAGGTSVSVIGVGNAGSTNSARARMMWNNVAVRMNSPNQQFGVQQELTWRGGKYLVGPSGASPSFLMRIGAQGRGAPVLIEGVDFTELGVASDFFSGPQSSGRAMIRNCLLPPGWVGQLVQGAIDPGFRATMHNCDSGSTRIRMAVAAFNGTIRTETAFVKQDGASDGSAYSWRIETNANPTPGLVGLESEEQAFVIPAAGAPLTVAIDVLTEGVQLTDADVWLEVQEVGAPKGTFYRSRVAPLATPKALPASGATWSTSGMAAPRPQRVSLTFTPQVAGLALWKITLARPNTVMCVDPKRVV